MRSVTGVVSIAFAAGASSGVLSSADDPPGGAWRPLPLSKDGKVEESWAHLGWGSFAVLEDGSLRTDCDPRGMGLLFYRKERFGDCQIRVVYRCDNARSNSGVFVRIDDGVLSRIGEKSPPVERNEKGGLVEGAMEKLQASSESEKGAWYPVHHGFEVQVLEDSDEYHRTGAVYSLAKSSYAPAKPPVERKTLVITLQGDLVLVDVDGKRVTSFDPEGKDVPKARKWFEPKREPKRPRSGTIGLQNHDPGDVVYFKEVSVRPLGDAR
jgi:Domain of Unknown Function (DUF1080)